MKKILIITTTLATLAAPMAMAEPDWLDDVSVSKSHQPTVFVNPRGSDDMDEDRIHGDGGNGIITPPAPPAPLA